MKRLLALSTLLLAIPPAGANAAESRRPNILFILVDDQSPFDLKVYNPESAAPDAAHRPPRPRRAWSSMAPITWARSSARSARRRGT